MYKFRSMTMEAPTQGPAITVGGDLRVTKIGAFLRRTKLDELPELVNVLKGEMSIVGPRPEIRQYVEKFQEDYKEILRVRPGITDFAALEFIDEEKILQGYDKPEDAYEKEILPQKIKLYKKYLLQNNFTTDIKIIVLTMIKLFR